MTRQRANKKEARSGILVIFAAPGACVTRVPVPEISRPSSFPLCGRSYVPASRFHHAGHADDTVPVIFSFLEFPQLSRPDLLSFLLDKPTVRVQFVSLYCIYVMIVFLMLLMMMLDRIKIGYLVETC